MKTSLYIETSVVSYFTARLSKNLVIAGHQAATADFWERLPQLVTWNFKHMNNSALRGKIRSTITDAGWICPDICSPEEV